MEAVSKIQGLVNGSLESKKMKDLKISPGAENLRPVGLFNYAPLTFTTADLDATWVNIDSDEGESCASSDWSSPGSTPAGSPRAETSGRKVATSPIAARSHRKDNYAAAVENKLAPSTPDANAPGLTAPPAGVQAQVAATNGDCGAAHPRHLLPNAKEAGAAAAKTEATAKADFELSKDYFRAELDSVQELAKDRTYKVTLKTPTASTKPLQMFIGEHEGKSLLQAFNGWKWQQQGCKRPLTYDFMKNAVEALGRKVAFVRVCTSERGVFYARTHFEMMVGALHDEAAVTGVDSRPSDALNLALRFGAPVYVHRQLMLDVLG